MPPVQDDRRAEDLLLGAFAVLALRGIDTLRTTDKTFHQRFDRALGVFKQAGGDSAALARYYHRDVVSKTYDQLDHALIAAEQLGWVKFPNPSYNRIQITMSPRDAQLLLNEWGGDTSTFERAADELLKTVPSA